jgi:hypothetical protein
MAEGSAPIELCVRELTGALGVLSLPTVTVDHVTARIVFLHGGELRVPAALTLTGDEGHHHGVATCR